MDTRTLKILNRRYRGISWKRGMKHFKTEERKVHAQLDNHD